MCHFGPRVSTTLRLYFKSLLPLLLRTSFKNMANQQQRRALKKQKTKHVHTQSARLVNITNSWRPAFRNPPCHFFALVRKWRVETSQVIATPAANVAPCFFPFLSFLFFFIRNVYRIGLQSACGLMKNLQNTCDRWVKIIVKETAQTGSKSRINSGDQCCSQR